MRRSPLLLLAILLAIVSPFLISTPLMAATEEPSYETLIQDDAFAVRRYQGVIVAETEVTGTLEEASNEGFQRVAGYIFGSNRSRTSAAEQGETIAMTAPVMLEAASEKIAMTAPVSIEGGGKRWRLQFVMPAKYTLETLPTPLHPDVRLRAVPAARMAVVRFSGLADAALLAEKTEALRAWISKQGLEAAGEPQLARYNPPWIPPEARRNEVLIPLR